MDEQKWMKLTAEVMRDETDITIVLKIKDLWMVDSALSLTVRHPGISEFSKDWYIHLSQLFQQPVIALHPEAKELMALGWRTDMDVPIDYEAKARRDEMYQTMSKKFRRKTGRE